MEEAKAENDVSPLLIWLNLLKEVGIDDGGVGSGKTGLDSLRRLKGDLDSELEQTQRESLVLLSGNPETEAFVDLLALGVKDFFHLSHELEGKMAVVEHDPTSVTEVGVDGLHGGLLHTFSHGDLLDVDLLLSGKLINVVGRIGSWLEKIEERLGALRLIKDVREMISDGGHVLVSKDAADELLGSEHSSVFSDGSHKTEMEEGSDAFGGDLIFVVDNGQVLGRVVHVPGLPLLLALAHLVRQVTEEWLMVVVELVFRECQHVKPGLLVHPVEFLVSVIDTGSCLEEQVDIGNVELLGLDKDL
jgi:hypothetical protein